MKKILSILLALVMLLACAFSAVAEDAEEKKAEEAEKVMEWLSTQISEDEAPEMLTWDKETILAKLEGYDQPLEYVTKEEIADEMAQAIGLFSALAGAAESGESGEASMGLISALLSGVGDGDEGAGLGALLGGALTGTAVVEGEGEVDLGTLLGTLLSGGVDLSFGDSDSTGEEEADEFSYLIVDIFNGTFWESGDLKLESVFQDGYYKVAITEGEKELSYLCEFDEAAADENGELRLNGIGTGVEELDAEQEDHGIATFALNDEGNLVWNKVDGTEVIFTEIVDALSTGEWYADGKMLHITWYGDKNYGVLIDDWREGNNWSYECTLDEATDTLTGTGKKEQFGDEVYADANVTLTFSEDRALLTWKDDKAEETADGVTFEIVEQAFTQTIWVGEGLESFSGYFNEGKYVLSLIYHGTEYGYVCTYDRAGKKLTAADPATLNPEEYSEFERYQSTATFELLDADHLRWTDDSGITGAEGIVLQPMQ